MLLQPFLLNSNIANFLVGRCSGHLLLMTSLMFMKQSNLLHRFQLTVFSKRREAKQA